MKVLLFTNHANDPLSFAIKAIMRTGYTHAALLVDEAKMLIVEAFWPEVRSRALAANEVAGVDAFEIAGLTPEKEAAILAFCEAAIAAHEKYSIANLFRFLAPARAILGETTDAGNGTNPVFCSQFVFDAITHGGGIPLFSRKVHSGEVDPGHLAWSPVLVPSRLESPKCQVLSAQ